MLQARRNRKSRTIGRVRRLNLESLEDRRLLAVLSWDVQSDYFGTQDVISQARSLRGLALSADDAHVYGGFIQGTTSASIREVSAGINSDMIGNEPIPYGTNPSYTTGLEARVTTFTQPKGLATDDRGYVYSTLSTNANAGSQNWGIYSSNLSAQVALRTSLNPVSSQLSNIATAKLSGNYYAYVGWNNGLIERWNVNDASNPVLDTAWGSPATPGKISLKTNWVNAYLRAIDVDADGTLFVAGGILGTTSFGDSLIKIPAAAAASGSLATATQVHVQGGANGSGGYAAGG